MSHAIHTPKTSACITLQAMMIDPHPPAERLRIAAQQLDAALDSGEYARLASHQLVSRNAGVMGAQRSPTLGGARFSIRLPLDVASSTV